MRDRHQDSHEADLDEEPEAQVDSPEREPPPPGRRSLLDGGRAAPRTLRRKGRPGVASLTGRLAPILVDQAAKDTGAALPAELRKKYEAALGVELADVRVHVGAASARAAEAVSARAYTVGRGIFFGAGEYDPWSADGERLLAHEVAHTAQGSSAPAGGLDVSDEHDAVEHEADAAADAMVAGRRAPALAAAPAPELRRVLSPRYPDMRTELSGGSVTAAQAQTVLGLLNPLVDEDLGDTVAQLQRDSFIEPLLDAVAAADRVAHAVLLMRIAQWRGPTALLAHITRLLARPGAAASSQVLDLLRWSTIAQERIIVHGMARAGLFQAFLTNISAAERTAQDFLIRRLESHNAEFSDRLQGTHQLDQASRDRVQGVLQGGASGVPTAAVFRDVDPGSGLTYRDHIMQTLDARRTTAVPRVNAMFARTPIPLSRYETIGTESKRHTDAIFGRYATGPALTSRGPNPNIRNQSAIRGDAADMIDYLIHSDAQMQAVHRAHNARTGGASEAPIIAGVIRDYFSTRSGVSAAEARQREDDMRLIDRGWPATAGGGIVRVQPFEGATPADTRRDTWKSFQTLIHEYLHTITHTNFDRAARALPSREQKDILIEGGTSLFTDKVWNSIFPEEIRSNDALRASVEGSALPFDPAAIPAITHYRQIAQARQIEAEVGEENFRAAYFLGQVELIGLGNWTSALAGAEGSFTVPAGMTTLADVATATGATEATIAPANGLAVGAAVTTGQVIRVPGMRLHVSIAGQTGTQIADLNGVPLASLRRLNPTVTAGAVPAGTSVMIPVH